MPSYCCKTMEIIESLDSANERLVLQKGCFTYSDLRGLEAFIQNRERERKITVLFKYILSTEERPTVWNDLIAMNINRKSLFGMSAESICLYYKQQL